MKTGYKPLVTDDNTGPAFWVRSHRVVTIQYDTTSASSDLTCRSISLLYMASLLPLFSLHEIFFLPSFFLLVTFLPSPPLLMVFIPSIWVWDFAPSFPSS